jgi:hypothetical protein
LPEFYLLLLRLHTGHSRLSAGSSPSITYQPSTYRAPPRLPHTTCDLPPGQPALFGCEFRSVLSGARIHHARLSINIGSHVGGHRAYSAPRWLVDGMNICATRYFWAGLRQTRH